MHNIARYAGVSIGSIDHHFHDQEGVAQPLYHALLARMVTELDVLRETHASVRAQFGAIVQHLFALAEREPAAMRFMLHAQHREFLPKQPPICSSRPFQMLQEVAAAGIANGAIRKLDPSSPRPPCLAVPSVC